MCVYACRQWFIGCFSCVIVLSTVFATVLIFSSELGIFSSHDQLAFICLCFFPATLAILLYIPTQITYECDSITIFLYRTDLTNLFSSNKQINNNNNDNDNADVTTST